MENNTIKEITNQFTTWLKIDDVLSANQQIITNVKDYLDAETNIIFTGAGTSGYIGDFLVPYLNQGQAVNSYQSIYSTNIVDSPQLLIGGKKVLLVSFARSGNSPESCEAVKLCNLYAKECKHLIITCNKEGELGKTHFADTIFLPTETNDRGFAMTNSFSTMLITAAKIFGLKVDLIKLVNEAKDLYEKFDYEQILSHEFQNIIYLANAENVGLIEELKLKFMELTNGKYGYYHDQFLNFRHGPKSVITKKSLILILTNDTEVSKMYETDLINELANDENKPVIVGLGTTNQDCLYNYPINLGGFEKALSIIPACQKLAVVASEKCELNPDNPSPSGSVNRVVQGVKIYGRTKC